MLKKLVPWMIIVLVAITLIALAAFILWDYIVDDRRNNIGSVPAIAESRLSAEQIQEQTVKLESITTNLADIQYIVRMSFAFLLSNPNTKEEMESIQHLVEANIIKVLSDTMPEEISGSEGMERLTEKLKELTNPLLTKGEVSQIDITEYILTGNR